MAVLHLSGQITAPCGPLASSALDHPALRERPTSVETMPKSPSVVQFEYRTVAGVPVLVASSAVQSRGTLLWYHGFGVDKDANRAELELFARAGFLAIGVDVAGHGDRRAPDLDERMRGSQQEALTSVIEFALLTARELPELLDGLLDAGLCKDHEISIAGISMGAFVVYRALIEEPRIRAAVAILGSPEWPAGEVPGASSPNGSSPNAAPLNASSPHAVSPNASSPNAASPHLHVRAFCNARILSITAECDVNVPPAPARRFHERIRAQCPCARERFLELKGAVHLMNAVDWQTTMAETISWLAHPHD
jgi:pimeloyl-ACP methyl ester carboxylesterase